MAQGWTAIIPLRAGSKGLANKNTLPLNGVALYQHTLKQARDAGAQKIVITTDIQELLEIDHGADVVVKKRAPKLATDTTSMEDVLLDLLTESTISGAIVLLQATSPLRTSENITDALALFQTAKFDLVKSVTKTSSTVLKYGTHENGKFVPLVKPEYCFTNRQMLPDVYRPNGAVYVFDADWLRGNKTLATPSIGMIEMHPNQSHDIDTIEDFQQIEAVLKNQNK